MKLAIAALMIIAANAPAFAGGPRTRRPLSYQPGWSQEQKCYRKVYREEYVPGTSQRPGYVEVYRDRVEVPCERLHRPTISPPPRYEEPNPNVGSVDNNSCVEGSILGGIGGAGLGAALSRDSGRLWAIPLGIVGGSMIGCQIDGG